MHYMNANKTYGEKAGQQLYKNAVSNTEQARDITTHKTAAVGPPTNYHENYPS